MNKVVRDGRVAVLYSPGYGAGWFSWNTEYPEIIFDPGLVDLVEQGDKEKILAYVNLKWPDAYTGGLEDLQIEWLPAGTEFVIDETDGAEFIKIKDDVSWITA
jgi:hypothetical protein